ncbi:uncharacterized protein LOC62_02G003133 [Vanrija pseudolonga]|uniref:Uncharacterized protein n=1 Tax=Vanrija pseudolonga TaxID=143232 RepID=A0AAF0Y8C6_9TREE|nr:hypothetical protein LOC62_02G003133 [Vanrija pseudolonga]
MFARAAARSLRPVATPLQATSKRFASGAPASGKERRYLRDMPVDVYPLAFLVTVVCSGSIYMCAHHLITDKSLRLLPDSARAEAKKH